MLTIAALLAKIGVPTALGWWLDWCLDDRETKAIRKRVDDWWIKFDNITWFNLGQEEGKAALTLFDRVFGSKLWSRHRWISVCVVVCVGLALALIPSLVDRPWDILPPPTDPSPLARSRQDAINSIMLTVLWLIPIMPIHCLGLALSLSITRTISKRVCELPGRWSIFGFLVLLVGSFALLVAWVPLFAIWKLLAPVLIVLASEGGVSIDSYSDIFEKALQPTLAFLDGRRSLFDFSISVFPKRSLVSLAHVGLSYADFFASTMRVSFSAFFVSVVFLRRFVHRPLSKLGFTWVTAKTPLFATLFGAVALVVVVIHEVYKAS